MTDFDDLRIFERVATLRSFSAAARALGIPKASVSRAVGRLEARLGVRLLQRTTRAVTPTGAGDLLRSRSQDILVHVEDAFAEVESLNRVPRGRLRISVGIGFGQLFLSDLLATFVERYPEVDVSVDMTSRNSELVSENIDVAVRMGPLPTSSLIAVRLGAIERCLCAAPSYLDRRGTPQSPADLHGHDIVEMPGTDGRPRALIFTDAAGHTVSLSKEPRIGINDVLTVYRLAQCGAGIAGISTYLGAADFASGALVKLLPDWRLPSIDVSILYPSNRDLAPAVRAFIDMLKGFPDSVKGSRPAPPWTSQDT